MGSGPAARAEHMSFRSYGATEGLSNAWFSCLTQDETGFIFTCTEHGLYVYDGRRFSNLGPKQGLPDGGIVEAMAITASRRIILRYPHRLYVSVNSVSLDVPPDHLSFVPASSEVGSIDDDGNGQLVAWGDGAILAAQNRLFYVTIPPAGGVPVVGTARGLLRDQGVSLQEPTPLAVGAKSLWLAEAGGGICRLAAQVRRCFGPAEGLPADEWDALLVQANGHIIARSMTRLAEIDPDSGTVDISALPYQGGRYANYVHRLLLVQTPEGRLLTQWADGLMVRETNGWRILGAGNGLPLTPILTVLFDHESALWIGALGKGAMRARGYGIWDNIDHQSGLSNDVVWQMDRQPGGPLWVATDDGIDAVGSSFDMPNAKRHYGRPAFALTTDAWGHVWQSDGSTGVSVITVATGETKTFRTPAVNQILHGAGSRLWLITEKGVYQIRDSRNPTAPEPLEQLSGKMTAAVAAPDGSLWLLRQASLVHWRGGNSPPATISPPWRESQFEPLTLALAKSGLLWVGGAGDGLYRLSLTDDHLTGMVQYGLPNIVSNTIVSSFVDSRGWVWAGTDNGISVFNGFRWVSANTDAGLVWNDLDQGALFEDVDGSMWIGTSQGLSHLRDPADLFTERALKPVISSVTIGDEAFLGRAVAYSRKPLEIHFGVLNFREDEVVRFRYRLKGVDEAWADTASGYARYASIPAGRHEFEVVAYDPLSHRVSSTVSVLLRMKAPLWARWPMIVLYMVGAGLLGYGALRLRIRLLLLRQRALQHEVDSRTLEMREAQAALHLLATQDSLTKLLTRREIQARLDESLAAGNALPRLTIGLFDIDHFKKINDRYGHLAGDDILEEMGRRIRDALQPGEHAGRYGGEEILVVLAADELFGIDRIHELKSIICGEPFIIDGSAIHVTISAGVARAHSKDNWKSLVGRADRALYAAKDSGRNRIIVASAMTLSAQLDCP
jgi:diguanylate cyclase (GGDEF)-like protein